MIYKEKLNKCKYCVNVSLNTAEKAAYLPKKQVRGRFFQPNQPSPFSSKSKTVWRAISIVFSIVSGQRLSAVSRRVW